MKKALKIIWKTVKWVFIVFFVYLVSLFFREERIPGAFVEWVSRRFLPPSLVLHAGSLSFGFMHGVHVRDIRLYDWAGKAPLTSVISADDVDWYPFMRKVRIAGLRYVRLPEDYYRDGSHDKNEPVEVEFPDLGHFQVEMTDPDVLGVRPRRLDFNLDVGKRRIEASHIVLQWPDCDVRAALDGFCYVDIDRQEVYGEVKGLAKQAHIRPLIEAVDVPVALPYIDAFTDVPVPCPSWCAWKVGLVHNDFDLWLDLKPTLGKYMSVPMTWANGKINVHNFTRDNQFCYVTTVGPISAEDVEGRPLEGTVVISSTNGMNTVAVKAKSAQPLANVLKIGGFEGDYVGADVIGNSQCDLTFRFPRAMTNDDAVLNGRGHVSVASGYLMRMRGFAGLIEAMPSIAPAVTWFSDSTEASADYVIENGVVKSDNIYIEGTCFSIKMTGSYDAVKDKLDFKVMVQFAKKDSLVGKLLHPLTWPFSKLLLEFKLSGSPSDPKWSYVTVIDRVLEVVK